MALSSAVCCRMMKACQDAQVLLTVGHVTRWMEALQVARSLIDDGSVGDVRIIQTWRLMAGGLPFPEGSWALDPTESGPFLDWGSHGCDTVRWLAGADALRCFDQSTGFGADQRLQPSTMAQITFANGVMAQIWMTYELPDVALGSRARYVVVGSRATLDISAFGQVLRSREDGGWDSVYRSAEFDRMRPVWGYPSECLREAFVRQIGDLTGAVMEGKGLAVTAQNGEPRRVP